MLDARLRHLIDPPLDRLAAALAGQACVAALALILVNRVCDGLDGALARRKEPTDLGGFLDITFDFIFYAAIPFGFALADPASNGLAAAFLIFSFVGTGSSFLAFAVMAAKRGLSTELRGRKSISYLGGLTEGSETIAAFVLACLLPAHFPLIALVFGLLCWITTAMRVALAWQTLR
jgi:phosphatidylglycerophosphate synthase